MEEAEEASWNIADKRSIQYLVWKIEGKAAILSMMKNASCSTFIYFMTLED